AWLADFETVEEDVAEPHTHEGSEFIYLLSGKLSITIGRRQYELNADDSIYFDAVVPHWYTRVGKGRCRAVVVTAP
ncbi:MAG: cupin domain-containing protein, partial [Thermoanaerobaculia bacterium]|nr:cupin domain-containing protein [Thermoanaerobaculia bacterium]